MRMKISILRYATRCSGYISLLFSLDQSDIITKQSEVLLGRNAVFELTRFFAYRINKLYELLSRDIQTAFNNSKNNCYPKTAIYALEVITHSLKSCSGLSWECGQIAPLVC